jgi:hypothetical protein
LKNLKERDHLEELGVDVRIIEKYGGKLWTGCIWLRIGTVMNTVMKLLVP